MAAISNAAIACPRILTSEEVSGLFETVRNRRSLSVDSNISTDVSSASSFWESSDDGDLSSGLELDSWHSDTDLLSTEYEDSDVSDEWSENDGEVLKKRPRLDVVAAASSDLSSRTRSRGRGKRYVTARRKTGKGERNGESEVSSDEEDYARGVGGGNRRGGAGSGRRGGGGAGSGYGGGRGRRGGRGGQGRVHSRGRGGGGRRGKKASRSRGKGTRGGTHSRLQANDTAPVSITEKDTGFIPGDSFCPLRQPGVYIPQGKEISALSLFELFFDDESVSRIVHSTLSYAESRKEEKKNRYALFMRKPFTKEEVRAFLGCLILLGIHNVHNYRKAWSESRAQYLVRLQELMTCQRFELIGTFLHIVTVEEEEAAKDDQLRKIRPLYDHIKQRCLDLYQPLQHLSVDERMVKSKARSHFVQYMKDKPVKWGFKFWVIADPLRLYAEKASLRQAVKDSTLASVSYTVFIPALT